jgi:hypothetical protein
MKYIKLFEELNREDILVSTIKGGDIEIAKHIVAKQFEDKLPYEDSLDYLDEVVDFDKSYIAKENNNVVGVLLIGDSIIYNLKSNETWKQIEDVDLSGKGIEGVALVILPEYRRSFAAYKLISELGRRVDWNYITIQQYEGMEETVNYFNKAKLIGFFMEEENRVDVFYIKKPDEVGTIKRFR